MTGRSPGLLGSITATYAPHATVVRLTGEIDANLRPQASTAMSGSLHHSRPLVLDASQVTFIDPSGVAFLIQCRNVAHAHGLTVSLQGCPPCVEEMLELADATAIFDDTPAGAGGPERPAAAER